jgi:hypothetical protein
MGLNIATLKGRDDIAPCPCPCPCAEEEEEEDGERSAKAPSSEGCMLNVLETGSSATGVVPPLAAEEPAGPVMCTRAATATT